MRFDGIGIKALPGVEPDLRRYACIADDGSETETVPLGAFSGTRGTAKTIRGIAWYLGRLRRNGLA